jgi:hypothetical protein
VGSSAPPQPTPAEVLESLDEGYFVEVRTIPMATLGFPC